MATFTIDAFNKICLRLSEEEAELLQRCLFAAGAYETKTVRQDILIGELAGLIVEARKEAAARPQVKPVVVEHDDHHNHPRDIHFDSLEQAAQYIWERDAGRGVTVETVLQRLHDDEEWSYMDQWTVLHDC